MSSQTLSSPAVPQFPRRHRIAVIGSGNWGSTIAKVVAENTMANPTLFDPNVNMWVYEEMVMVNKPGRVDAGIRSHHVPSSIEQQPLSKVINELHENVKYLPGCRLPDNVVANPSITDTVSQATILIFNLPHEFISQTCQSIAGHILPYARAISCVKGINVSDAGVRLIADQITDHLNIYCGALSGANIANEVAAENFSETTVAYLPPDVDSSPIDNTTTISSGFTAMPVEYPPLTQSVIRKLFHRPYFHAQVVSDLSSVSLGGALKNVVALAAGFVDALGWGENAKAAILRVGLLEIIQFTKTFFSHTHPSFNPDTLFHYSCGFPDLVASCAAGRNFRAAKQSITQNMPIHQVERDTFNGQKIQGISTARALASLLRSRNLQSEYPLFIAVDDILNNKISPNQLPALIEHTT